MITTMIRSTLYHAHDYYHDYIYTLSCTWLLPGLHLHFIMRRITIMITCTLYDNMITTMITFTLYHAHDYYHDYVCNYHAHDSWNDYIYTLSCTWLPTLDLHIRFTTCQREHWYKIRKMPINKVYKVYLTICIMHFIITNLPTNL